MCVDKAGEEDKRMGEDWKDEAENVFLLTSGVWVNSLWFMNLVINLTCAVLTNLLQHCARVNVRDQFEKSFKMQTSEAGRTALSPPLLPKPNRTFP
ncbi:hypothetical protein EI94DRAFT_1791345 [Lactarius quietus]|nr:hypothetical protein EI94DRAFT_1791345 [Lactarius quietus]